MTLTEIIRKVLNQEIKEGKYNNGDKCQYQRFTEDGKEFTLVDGHLYYGEAYNDGARETYSTVPRLMEFRREDSLNIGGYKARFAALIAKNVKGETDYFKTCTLEI